VLASEGIVGLVIRSLREEDAEDVVKLSLLAWSPVFESFERLMGSKIFRTQYPDWRASQGKLVKDTCSNPEKFTVYVAEVGGAPVGFVAYTMDAETKTGEIYLLAVHPDHQMRGIGTELTDFALDMMREGGMEVAYVGTGGDPSHAPARRSYKKAGFDVAVPGVHYYQDLQQ
jgi:ribosomal protein S18 acetylase RimI-like enzyme